MAASGYGIVPTGWYGKPLVVIEGETDSGLKRILGDSAGTEDDGSIPIDSAAGQLKALIVDPIAALWDLGEAIFASLDPSKATDSAQDVVNSLSGTIRNPARYSVATGTLVGDANTFLPVGRVAGVTGTGALYQSATGTTLGSATAWQNSVYVPAGAFNSSAGNVYRATTGGTSSTGAVGPSGIAIAIADGTVVWRFLGQGLALAHVPFNAQVSGPVGGLADRLVVIGSPQSGWNAIDNQNDAIVGANQEKDSAFRARREAELATSGNTTADAIRANILKVNQGSTDPNHQPPTVCKVFYNDTDITNSEGVPPHSYEALVQGGTTSDIAQAIWDSTGAGTRTYGSRSDTVTDSEGNTQTVKWTRPTEIPIYIVTVGRYDPAEWPTGSELLVAQAILSALLTYTVDWPVALDVRISPLIGAAMRGPSQTSSAGAAVVPADPGADPVPGLLELETLYIGTSPGPVAGTQIAIGTREIATFDSTRCTVTATSEAP